MWHMIIIKSHSGFVFAHMLAFVLADWWYIWFYIWPDCLKTNPFSRGQKCCFWASISISISIPIFKLTRCDVFPCAEVHCLEALEAGFGDFPVFRTNLGKERQQSGVRLTTSTFEAQIWVRGGGPTPNRNVKTSSSVKCCSDLRLQSQLFHHRRNHFHTPCK